MSMNHMYPKDTPEPNRIIHTLTGERPEDTACASRDGSAQPHLEHVQLDVSAFASLGTALRGKTLCYGVRLHCDG